MINFTGLPQALPHAYLALLRSGWTASINIYPANGLRWSKAWSLSLTGTATLFIQPYAYPLVITTFLSSPSQQSLKIGTPRFFAESLTISNDCLDMAEPPARKTIPM